MVRLMAHALDHMQPGRAVHPGNLGRVSVCQGCIDRPTSHTLTQHKP